VVKVLFELQFLDTTQRLNLQPGSANLTLEGNFYYRVISTSCEWSQLNPGYLRYIQLTLGTLNFSLLLSSVQGDLSLRDDLNFIISILNLSWIILTSHSNLSLDGKLLNCEVRAVYMKREPLVIMKIIIT